MAPANRSGDPTRLCVYNAGFFREARVKRILALAGWEVAFGVPGPDDWVGVWGQSPTSGRGEAVAARTDAPVLRVEDPFLRSVLPGRSGEPPMGLLLDVTGVHFDGSRPSRLETILGEDPLDDPALLARAKAAMERLRYWHLSKYSCWDLAVEPPEGPYVLVIDQTQKDASLPDDAEAVFAQMLEAARKDYPNVPLIIRTHPETAQGHRGGHYDPSSGARLLTDPISPYALLDGAAAVYTVSSTLGFEAILAGHRPHVFGSPFYAGWGLSDDRTDQPRRGRQITPEQLFAAAMIIAPTWYDPFRDALCELENVIDNLAARATAWRQDRKGWVGTNMSPWKHPHLKRVFGQWGRVDFHMSPKKAMDLSTSTGRPLMAWGNGSVRPMAADVYIEDGFLRSRGLGAELVPASAFGIDDIGIHFDPTGPSRMERLISGSVDLPRAEIERAERLLAHLNRLGLTKYNISGDLPDFPDDRRVCLVVGQVEDDAAVLTARPDAFGNADLLQVARRENPEAYIVFKPHPDVEAGLRKGKVSEASSIADLVLSGGDPAALLSQVDDVWTLSSTLGFEALLRDVPVTCLGAPFYAGWGLTTDIGPVPDRRGPGPSLAGITHAALIGYQRYIDPVTGAPCPVEVAVDRLADGIGFKPPGLLARLQRLKAWLP
ncbi:MAG: capsular polysaccharide biosynthesis protein [Pseudomonadota bacterium]